MSFVASTVDIISHLFFLSPNILCNTTARHVTLLRENMNGLSGFSAPPKSFDYNHGFAFSAQGFGELYDTTPWLPDSTVSDDRSELRRKSGKRSKRTKKHRSKSHKKYQKHQIGAYILQAIGLVCLVLAAIKSFEPLAGVGFTLVLIGHNKGLGKMSEAGKLVVSFKV